jgi:hypothetical protein
LPAAAKDALGRAFPGAAVGPAETFEQFALAMYRVKVATGPAAATVTVSADGVVARVESACQAGELPAAVARGVAAAGGGGQITQVRRDEVRADLELKALPSPRRLYELRVADGTRRGQVKLAADGTVMEPLRWQAGHPEDEGEIEDSGVPLPANVRQAILKVFQRASLNEVEVRDEYGVRIFNVETIGDGMERHVEATAEGLVVRVESPITPTRLPKPVAEAAAKIAPGTSVGVSQEQDVLAAARLSPRKDPRVLYHVELSRDGKRAEALVDATGVLLRAVKWR